MWENLLSAFQASLQHLDPTTRRFYFLFATALAERFEGTDPQSLDYYVLEQWYSMLPERRQRLYRARSKRFIRFIEEVHGMQILPQTTRPSISGRMIDSAWAKTIDIGGKANLSTRRDLALLAAFCATARSLSKTVHLNRTELSVQPDGSIKVGGQNVTDLRLTQILGSWHRLRLSLDRPREQARFRKPLDWAASPLLFPGAHGKPLSRSSISSAVRRLVGIQGLTPGRLRSHFQTEAPEH